MDAFGDMVKFPHSFDYEQQRDVLVISQKQEVIEHARRVGVSLALGPEIIKMAQVSRS